MTPDTAFLAAFGAVMTCCGGILWYDTLERNPYRVRDMYKTFTFVLLGVFLFGAYQYTQLWSEVRQYIWHLNGYQP